MLGIRYSLPSSTLPGWQEGLADSWVNSLEKRVMGCWATYRRRRGEQWEQSNWHILNKKFEPFMWILTGYGAVGPMKFGGNIDKFCFVTSSKSAVDPKQSKAGCKFCLCSRVAVVYFFLWTDQQRFRSGRTPLRILPHPHWREMKASQTTPHNENTSSRPNGLWATAFVPWLANLFRVQPPNCVACLATQHYSKN